MAVKDIAPRPLSSVADLLQQPNIWADWMVGNKIGSLSTWRLVALLLRDVPVEQAVDRLAPALLQVDGEAQRHVIQYMHQCWIPEGEVFGFEQWLELWEFGGVAIYGEAATRTVSRLGGSADVEFLKSILTDDVVEPLALLWFLLNAVQAWAASGNDFEQVTPAARWLVELFDGENGSRDPLGVLLAWLYNRFRGSGHCETKPLPTELTILEETHSLHYDSSSRASRSEEDVLWQSHQTAHFEKRAPTLADILGDDARSWPEAAVKLGALRKQGLVSASRFSLTPRGQWEIDIRYARMDSPDGMMEPFDDSMH